MRSKTANVFEILDDGTTRIKIGYKGGFVDCYIDTEDQPRVENHQWRVLNTHGTFYARANVQDVGRTKMTYMHVLLFPDTAALTGHITVDHRDRNGLNNRKENLRAATKRDQALNRKSTILHTTLKTKSAGIYTRTTGNPYQRLEVVDGKPAIAVGYRGKFYLRVSEDHENKFRRKWVPFCTLDEALKAQKEELVA